MNNDRNWQIMLGIGLVALSAAIYFAHYSLFRDAHHIFIYLLGDIAFVPIEVLLVTLIIHRLLGVREKRAMLKKLNMVIGVFYSEVGTGLLGTLSQLDPDIKAIRDELKVTGQWKLHEFQATAARLKGYGFKVSPKPEDLKALTVQLRQKRWILLGLLENPNLLEHDTFTDLLWAVFHLAEELSHRQDVMAASKADLAHLAGDATRAYGQMAVGWLSYMEHLMTDYPYLFSLAIRTNPFDPEARAEL